MVIPSTSPLPINSSDIDGSSRKVSAKGYFKWTEELKHTLAKEVRYAQAHKNTKGSSTIESLQLRLKKKHLQLKLRNIDL